MKSQSLFSRKNLEKKNIRLSSAEFSGVARTKLCLSKPGKFLEILPELFPKQGLLLKERILLPLGAKFFPLRAAPMIKKQNVLFKPL